MVSLIFLFFNLVASLFKSKSRLEAENAALQHQLTVLQRKIRGRVQFTNSDRLFFIQLYRWCPSVLKAMMIIRPETVLAQISTRLRKTADFRRPAVPSLRVSRPAEFHHRPLAEPSVRLSPHSAPIRQTFRSTYPPVYKEVRVFSGQPVEEAARTALRSCKALELPHHPVPKSKIDVSEQGVQGRWCVSSVVFNPTP